MAVCSRSILPRGGSCRADVGPVARGRAFKGESCLMTVPPRRICRREGLGSGDVAPVASARNLRRCRAVGERQANRRWRLSRKGGMDLPGGHVAYRISVDARDDVSVLQPHAFGNPVLRRSHHRNLAVPQLALHAQTDQGHRDRLAGTPGAFGAGVFGKRAARLLAPRGPRGSLAIASGCAFEGNAFLTTIHRKRICL